MSPWVPTDAELEGLAREQPAREASADRVEHNRTNVLAGAASVRQLPRRAAWPIVAAVAVPLAAAAALVVWLGTRPSEPAAGARATLVGAYTKVTDWPDHVVRVDDGSLVVAIADLQPPDHFRVHAPDADVDTTGGHFVVVVRDAHLDSVTVTRGRVELRVTGTRPQFLAAGQTWTRTITAQRDVLVPPRPVTTPPPTRPPPPVVRRPALKITSEAPRSETTPVDVKPPAPPAPGEADFRTGMTSLRTGNAAAAVTAFSSSCNTVGAALAEDACFWVGAAARRAGQTATARTALERFLQRFPASARAGEAAALLGWIMVEAGELDAAEKQFTRAAADRVPRVRDSAARGLAAVRRAPR